MIPLTLSATEVQGLLTQGRARLRGPECLTTARAIYYWDAEAQHYAREPDVRPEASERPAPLRRDSFPRTLAQAWGIFAVVLAGLVSIFWLIWANMPPPVVAPAPPLVGPPLPSVGDVLVVVGLLLVGLVLLAGYFYVVLWPWRIAKRRHHPQAQAIGWLVGLFGWTFLGWGIAMVWAHMEPPPQTEAPHEL